MIGTRFLISSYKTVVHFQDHSGTVVLGTITTVSFPKWDSRFIRVAHAPGGHTISAAETH